MDTTGGRRNPHIWWAALATGLVAFTAGVFLVSSGSGSVPVAAQTSLSSVVDAARLDQVAQVQLGSGGGVAVLSDGTTMIGQVQAQLVDGVHVVGFRAPADVHDALLAELLTRQVDVEFTSTGASTYTPPGAGAGDALPVHVLAGGVTLIITGTLLAALAGSRLLTRVRSRRFPDATGDANTGGRPATRFADVAGCDEAVDQLAEMVTFLKQPQRFTALGAKLPAGALLVGPPGTGKTLLARAVAGEAGVPFFTASGSDFAEMYVGVGPKRIRALFAKARKAAPSVVFIDEIDAIARRRQDADVPGNGHQETENTLMALLTQLDGFASRGGVIVLAATNRPDVLDEALLRPGRLDRRVEVPLPDRRGRERILATHAGNVQVSDQVDWGAIAGRTPGFSGAQLASVVNEAALEAARRGLTHVTGSCLDAAVAHVAMGRARTSALVSDHDRAVTAWHEAGHTVAALLLADADRPVAVSIVPRGPAGGVTWMTEGDDLFLTRSKAHARLVVALSGRAGEQLLLDGEFTQGAVGDLDTATDLALAMATRYGMTRLGLASRVRHLGGTTTKEVADVVEELLEAAAHTARTLLGDHRDLVAAVAGALLEREDLSTGDLLEIAKAGGVDPGRVGLPHGTVPHPAVSDTVHATAATVGAGTTTSGETAPVSAGFRLFRRLRAITVRRLRAGR